MGTRKLKIVEKAEKRLCDLSTDEIIGRDASPKARLSPPVFEEELIDFTNPHVGWFTSVVQAARDKF